MTPFVIGWKIPPEEWLWARSKTMEEPPGGLFDLDHLAVVFMLNGRFQIRVGEQELFPRERLQQQWNEGSAYAVAAGDEPWGEPDPLEIFGVSTSLVGIAWKLDLVINRRGFRDAPVGTREGLREDDGQTTFWFEKTDDGVAVSSNHFVDIVLTVPEKAFYDEVDRFLTEFMEEIQHRLPVLLAWETFDELRRFVPDRGERQRYPRSPMESGAWYHSVMEAWKQKPD